MDHATFQRWLDSYIGAWRSNDRADIEALFTAEARYFYGPYQEPLVGREAIAADWLAKPDEPGSWEAEYRPLAIDGDVAIATGETRYADGKTYSNIFVCQFDGDGRCTEFREWFVKRPQTGS